MKFYKKTLMALQLLLTCFIPIYYNIFLLRFYSSLVCLVSFFEFYNQILRKNIIKEIFHILFYYWLLFPIVIINFLLPLEYCWDAIMITIFSDGIQQFSNKIFVSFYQQDDNFKKVMIYNPFSYISPRKTLIGYLGGLTTLFLYPFFNYNVTFIFLIYVSGCAGDLFASYFKRLIDIEDYSNYLGSHGGFLDRFDAIIINMHLIYILSLLSFKINN